MKKSTPNNADTGLSRIRERFPSTQDLYGDIFDKMIADMPKGGTRKVPPKDCKKCK